VSSSVEAVVVQLNTVNTVNLHYAQIPSSCVTGSGVFPFAGAVGLCRMWKHSLFAVGIIRKV